MLLQLSGRGKMSLSENLQKIRKEKGIKQEELAELSGVSLTQISKIERNETDPRVSTIEKLSKALSCSTDNLLFNEKNEHVTGILKRLFDTVSKMPENDKAALIKTISMACTGSEMSQKVEDFKVYEAMEELNRKENIKMVKFEEP